ncbi:Allantoate amidohydrolase [Escherichia coli]|nr:Allantoate amidohydrolase [Escherichia coli]
MITHFRQAIEETLPWLSSFGADPTGGMIRLLYSPEWLETQQQFKKRMAASGLETRFDEVGNLYGRLSREFIRSPEWYRISTGSDSERFAYRYRG